MRALISLLFATLIPSSLSLAPKRIHSSVAQVITSCVEPNTIALTFDDGPCAYTEQVLDLLRDYDARATFFVLGEAAQKHPELLRRMQDEHHQIGSHTFSHPSLPTLSHDAIVLEMTRLEDVLIPIIEQIPTYMRPPYFDISDEVLATMSELGYKVITASIDTKDYEHDTKDGVLVSYNKFLNELDAGGSIVLSHDTHYWTGASLVERMLIEISERGLTATTVGDCLGEPLDAWYRPA
ncbi:hypothetical protein ASPCAL02931 [Aspergillus calidoustus]|uniref:NodB homology domain-containing protein n=1 Tax=Aspergillus calidoustus TaxID=454130 RepID=A0A0U5GNN1_ASPCI|nr:hypothetical protein ASPCAL02931 [Aspergillus calidoustus]